MPVKGSCACLLLVKLDFTIILQQPSSSIMVWTGATADRRTDVGFNGRCCIDEVLRPHALSLLQQMGNRATFQDDTARPHRARIVHNFVQQNQERLFDWPAMSQDLSCIENAFDNLE